MRVLLSLLLACCCLPAAAPQLDKLTLPKGFHIAVYSDQVPNAREIALGANGTVFVGSNGAGKVYALTDSQRRGVADQVRVIASGLKMPIGVAFQDGNLYVSAVSRILVLRDIENHLDEPPTPELVTDKLPTETHHGCKFIAFGPDGKLYVPIGAPCNICDPAPDHAKMTRMNADGSGWEDVACGIRNSVGFDWQPGTGRLWFTDNGRDMMGDDMPSDELNEVTRSRRAFRLSLLPSGRHARPGIRQGQACRGLHPAGAEAGCARGLAGHALLYRQAVSGQLPRRDDHRRARLVEPHQKVRLPGDDGAPERQQGVSYEPLVTGFEQDESAWGRPVDVQPLPDGSVLISDDLAGAVYRVTYQAVSSKRSVPHVPIQKEIPCSCAATISRRPADPGHLRLRQARRSGRAVGQPQPAPGLEGRAAEAPARSC